MKIYSVKVNTKDIFWIVLDISAKFILVMIGSVFFARQAGVGYFGKYQYVFSLNGIATLVLFPGIQNALVNSTVKHCEGDFIVAFRKRLKMIPYFILFFVMVSFIIYLKNREGIDIVLSFLITGVISAFISLFDFNLSYFLGKREYRKLCFCDSLIAFSSVLVAIIYFFFSKILGFSYVPLTILILFPLLWRLLSCYLISIYIKSNFQNKGVESHDFFPYAKNLSFVSILASLQENLDQFIIGTFLSFESLAFYNIGKGAFEFLKNMWSISQQYLQPRLVKLNIEKARLHFKNYLKIYALMIVPFLVLLWFILPFLIVSFYGGQFRPSIIYSRLFLIVILFGAPNFYMEAFFRAKQFHRDLLYSRLVNFLFLVVLPIAIYYFQAYGIVYVRALSALSISMIMVYLFSKKRLA